MKIERGKHSKADLTDVLRKIWDVSKVSIKVAGIGAFAFMLSGCNIDKNIDKEINDSLVNPEPSIESTVNNEDRPQNLTEIERIVYNAVDESGNIVIPECYREYIGSELIEKESYSIEELEQVESLYIVIRDDSDLSWINYCTNLKHLNITVHTNGLSLKNIGDLPNLNKVDITTCFQGTINLDNFEFIKNNRTITELDLSDISDYSNMSELFNYIKELKNIKRLAVDVDKQDNIDVTQMQSLEYIDFGYSGPYDVAVYLSNDKLDYLLNNGVVIESYVDGFIEQVREINNDLDNIVEMLDIKEDATDKEKIDTILVYIMENFHYDTQNSEYLRNGESHDQYTLSFYDEGGLYAVFNNNGNIICGNYASLFQALSNRVGIENHFVISSDHAWNLVCVEGNYYYIDVTFMDSQTFKWKKHDYNTNESVIHNYSSDEYLKNGGDIENFNWYMVHPDEIVPEDTAHDVYTIPQYITVQPLEEIEITNDLETPPDITDKKFKISFGSKEYIICGGVLVGILAGLGGAVLYKKEKARKERFRRMMEEDSIPSYDFGYNRKY